MKIAIIGFGYVGKAMFEFFYRHYDCTVYDPKIKEALNSWKMPYPGQYANRFTDCNLDWVNECDLAVICVPTPMKEDGRCDTSMVHGTVKFLKTRLILLKSTVPPGTTEYLSELYEKRIVFSPEYCGESSYWTPYKFHTEVRETPFFIFGGQPDDTSEMVDIFLPITGPVKTYRQTDAKTAELAKYMENSFYATKITFCYEFYQIALALGVDFNELREVWLLDPRINPMHTAVFKGNKSPFSGKCLPKDLAGIIANSEAYGWEPKLLKEVQASNKRIAKALLEGRMISHSERALD